MATSAYSYFGLLEARTAGRDLPPDVALDGEGRPTTDANKALDGGAIQVFDRNENLRYPSPFAFGLL